jgi:dolichol-phosphate mannosyltransferase
MTVIIVRLLVKYVRFCVVGGSGVIVDMVFLWLLNSVFGMPLLWSKCVASEIAMISNFALNNGWTFRSEGNGCGWRLWLKAFVRFNIVCTAGMLLAMAVLACLHERFGIQVLIANACAIITASVFNYCLSKVFVWRAT